MAMSVTARAVNGIFADKHPNFMSTCLNLHSVFLDQILIEKAPVGLLKAL